MEVAELTAVVTANVSGLVSALGDAETALKSIQDSMVATEKSAAALGKTLKTAFQTGVGSTGTQLVAATKAQSSALKQLADDHIKQAAAAKAAGGAQDAKAASTNADTNATEANTTATKANAAALAAQADAAKNSGDELDALSVAEEKATKAVQAQADALILLENSATAAGNVAKTFASATEEGAIAADLAAAATLKYNAALRYNSVEAQAAIGSQEMLDRALKNSRSSYGVTMGALQNAERDFMAAMQNAGAAAPGSSEQLLYRLQAANALATIEQVYGKAVRVNNELLDQTYKSQNAIAEVMNVQILKEDELANAQAKTAAAIEKQITGLRQEYASSTAIVNSIKDMNNLTSEESAAIIQQARVKKELLAYDKEIESWREKQLATTKATTAAEEELTIAQQASLIAAARVATVTDLQSPVNATRSQISALQTAGIASNDPRLLTLQKQLADQEAALLAQQRRIGLVPPEEKAPPQLRIKPVESPFKAGAANEIDSVAKSTRGAAGSFFNLGTAAAFASTSFLVGLFGGTALRSVIEASRGLSTAQDVLGNTVRSVGGDWKIQQAAIESYVVTAANASGFTDTDLTNSLTKLVAATGSVKAGEAALTVTTNLARAKNLDLATATRDVTLVSEGHASVLRRQGIVLPVVTAATQQLKERLAAASDAGIHFTAASKLAATQLAKQHDAAATAAIDMVVLRSSVQGADAAYSKSSKGGIDQFKVALDRLKVSIGDALLPEFDKIVRELGKVASAWVKSGAVTKGAEEGLNLVKNTIKAIAPVIEDLYSALKDAVNALGGLKTVLIDLSVLWVAKFALLEHPVLTLAVALDQLLQHFKALHGVIGPLLAVAGGAFLAIQLGAQKAILQMAIFFGLSKGEATEFKSLTDIIVSGATAASAAISGTVNQMRGLAVATEAAAKATEELSIAQKTETAVAAPAVSGVVSRTKQYTGTMVAEEGAAAAATTGGEVAGGGFLAGLAEVPFGPIALGLTVVGGALLYFLSRATPVESATKALTKSLLGFQSAEQSASSSRLTVAQDRIALATAKSALATTNAARGSNAYRSASLAVGQATNQLSDDQQTLRQNLLNTAEAFKQATDKADGLLKASIQQAGENTSTAFEGRGAGADGGNQQVLQAQRVAESLDLSTKAIQKNIVANNQFSPTIQRNGLLLEQFIRILGDPKLVTPHEVQVILKNQDAKAQLNDLLAQLGKLPKEVVIQIKEDYLISTTGAPPSAVTGHPSGSLLQNYQGISQTDRNLIAGANTAYTATPNTKTLDALIAANQRALSDLKKISPNASSYELYQQDKAGLITAIKDLKAPQPDLTVKPGGGGKLTGLAAQIGAAAANRLSNAQAAANQAGSVTPGTYDPKVLEEQKKLRQTILTTIGLLHAKESQVGANTKEGVAIAKEIAGYQKQAATSLKNIDKEQAAKVSSAVNRRIGGILGTGSQNPVAASAARELSLLRTTLLDSLKHEGGKAGLAAFGPNVESDSIRQLIALIRSQPGTTNRTVNAIEKVYKAIELASAKHVKIDTDNTQKIADYLKQIKATLSQGRYASNYVAPSAYKLTAGIHYASEADRVAAEQRISQGFAYANGKIPGAGAAAGVPLPPYTNEGTTPGATPTKQPVYRRYPGPHQTIHIDNVNINDKNVWSTKKLQSEILTVVNRNTTQTKGANAGKRPA